LPPHAPGQRIGLYGGTFNPVHEGHRLVSLLALRRLELDSVWWLVTPGNPLKEVGGLPPLEERMRRAAEIAAHPAIAISAAEAAFRTRYTADLIRILKLRAAGTQFVWIMGGDNLSQFNRWDRWRDIAEAIPIAVVNRPGHLAAPLSAVAAQALHRWRIDESDAPLLASLDAPAWTHLTGPRTPVSSTELRGGRQVS
jgi:nicotinate-nucleotide adenylyltransferase